MQNPHCKPCASLNAACITPGTPLVLSPSTVVSDCPSACTANIVHDFIGVPLTNTVHAPQLVVSQPMCVPVSPAFVRTKSTRSVRGSTSWVWSVPFTVTVISTVLPFSVGSTLCLLRRGGERTTGEHADDVALPVRGPAHVVVG